MTFGRTTFLEIFGTEVHSDIITIVLYVLSLSTHVYRPLRAFLRGAAGGALTTGGGLAITEMT